MDATPPELEVDYGNYEFLMPLVTKATSTTRQAAMTMTL